MPGLIGGGIEVTRRMRAFSPDVAVLILTVHEDETLLREAIQAGASGYVIKRAAEARVVRIVATNVEIAGTDLEKLLHRMIAHQKILDTVERRGHRGLVAHGQAGRVADYKPAPTEARLDPRPAACLAF